MQGDFAANQATLDSLRGKSVTLYLDDNNVTNAAGLINFNSSLLIADRLDVATAHTHINIESGGETRMLWKGNATPGGINKVSNDFTATSTSTGEYNNFSVISANFITKEVLLSSGSEGGISGTIQSNLNQFLHFQYIDLANYRGTTNIYLNGQQVATEG